jgi:hypothetical protein
MALESVQLDTLTWDQMVTAIRTRIIANSKNNWTLHAPVDPGVTLLELFAWLLEQRIYWMDQVPDALVLAILNLLGESAKPKPAQAAVTLFQLLDLASPPRPFVAVAADTLMRLGDSNPYVLFSTDADLVLLPLSPAGIALTVDGVDQSNDLAQGRFVHLLGAGNNSAEIKIVLSLTGKIPAAITGTFSLMLELETPRDVFAEWTAEVVANVPAPATLTWNYLSSASGSVTPFSQVEDGTAGLRRSGVVRLPLPADWQPEPAPAGSTTVSYTLILQVANAGFTFVPRLVQVLANVVLAHHQWQEKKQPSTLNWLPLPGNVASLSDVPSNPSLQLLLPIENTVQVQITERDKTPNGTQYAWKVVPDLSFSGPEDRVCVVNRPRSEVRFGDGLTGRLPILFGTGSDIEVDFAAGGGSPGNVGANLNWESFKKKQADPDLFIGAVNVVASVGGSDSETLDAARQRAEAAINERNRAVSKIDYENLAKTTPGVALRRAYAAIGYHPDFPCTVVPGVVTVFVVPYAPREQTDGALADDVFVAAPQPDPGALQAARTQMDAARLLGSEVFVEGPAYRPVWLGVYIAVDSPLSAALRQQIVTRLRTFLDPLVGGDGGEGWPFGDPLRPSALLQQAQDVVGQAGDVLQVSILIDGMTTPESCRDVPILPHELVTLENVDLHMQPRTARIGGLR